MDTDGTTPATHCPTSGSIIRSAQQPALQSSGAPEHASDNSPANSPPHRICSLHLADGVIQYLATEIPDPPALSFIHDLARLDRLWDDRSPQWDNTSPLHIQGRSIALVYWPDIYRYQGTRQWSGIKQRWFEWKVRVYQGC
jgi:hypothetical protein